jgi:hypothetical protein
MEAKAAFVSSLLAPVEPVKAEPVYFTNGVTVGSLWRMPAEGGDATLVLDERIHHAKWTLWHDRIVYVDEPAAGAHHMVASSAPMAPSTALRCGARSHPTRARRRAWTADPRFNPTAQSNRRVPCCL